MSHQLHPTLHVLWHSAQSQLHLKTDRLWTSHSLNQITAILIKNLAPSSPSIAPLPDFHLELRPCPDPTANKRGSVSAGYCTHWWIGNSTPGTPRNPKRKGSRLGNSTRTSHWRKAKAHQISGSRNLGFHRKTSDWRTETLSSRTPRDYILDSTARHPHRVCNKEMKKGTGMRITIKINQRKWNKCLSLEAKLHQAIFCLKNIKVYPCPSCD